MVTQAPRPLRLSTLLDQQLWFIGHDIRHADGNALTRFGFERRRGSAGGTTCYQLASEDPARDLVCWGFGVYVGPVDNAARPAPHDAPRETPRGVFLQRHSLTPRLLSGPLALPLHQPSELPLLRSPVTPHDWHEVQSALRHLAAELARYEQWARDTLGTTHRAQVLAQVPRHKRRRFCAATDLAASWDAHAMVSTTTDVRPRDTTARDATTRSITMRRAATPRYSTPFSGAR